MIDWARHRWCSSYHIAELFAYTTCIVQGRSSSYGCYGFGRTTFQPTSKLESYTIRKLCVYLVRGISLSRFRHAVSNGSWKIDLLLGNTRFTYFFSPTIVVCFPNGHLGKLGLFIDHFRSLGWRKGHSFTGYDEAKDQCSVLSYLCNSS